MLLPWRALLWVVNTNNAAVKVTVANASAVTVYILGEGIAIRKDPGAVVDASTASGSVWASAIYAKLNK